MQSGIILVLCLIAAVCSVAALITVLVRKAPKYDTGEAMRRIEALRQDILAEARQSRSENIEAVQSSIKSAAEMLMGSERRIASAQDMRLSALQGTVTEMMKRVDARLESSSSHSETKLENIRTTMEKQLLIMQEDNSKKLEQMRMTVDEKLEKTLQERIGQSFRLVSERLEQVYRGLGEMRNLASDVGDLKKVLSNVKTRGILGEVQLGAILEQILAPEQYEINVATKPGSTCVVEYAVKLPGSGSGSVYLPIDAKFPADAYTKLVDAYDTGEPAAVNAAGRELEHRIKAFAKDIHDRYIDPPNTTDFGIMFLPFEGLYAEVVRRGLLEPLQRDYKVTVSGPTTLAAMLNSLQMGFRTLAIQKRSGEVWQVLGAVKTEFEKFYDVLGSAQQKLSQASSELDKLVGVRTRQIRRKLISVSRVTEDDASRVIDTPDDHPPQ